MKYLILAAGRGSRMGAYAETIPKTMLKFAKHPLLMHHLAYSEMMESKKTIVVKGFKEYLINFTKVKYYVNEDYESSNMVESLMTARIEFDDELIVAYGDIIYNPAILKGLIDISGDFIVTVDMNWENYWLMRYGSLNVDIESLLIDGDLIRDIGQPVDKHEPIDARYVGLMKLSLRGLTIIEDIYDGNPSQWRQAFMTDLLQELIDRGEKVTPYKINNGWLEFDTSEDYELSQKWYKEGTLEKDLNLKIR